MVWILIERKVMKMSKKIIIGIVVLVAIMGAMYSTHNYERTDCKVVAKCDGELTIQDKNGHYWYWYADSDNEWESYKAMSIGEKVSLKIYDNGTENNIEDDIIRKIEMK